MFVPIRKSFIANKQVQITKKLTTPPPLHTHTHAMMFLPKDNYCELMKRKHTHAYNESACYSIM